MKAQINFKVYNPEYDQEYADQYKGGEESESNWKYLSGVSYEVKNVKSVELIENGIYRLKGKKGNVPFDVPVPDVAIFRCHLNDGTEIDFAASRSILNKTHQVRNEKYKTIRCYFYLNSEPACAELGNLWIDENNIPED
jgi:hypothetical protein